MDSLKITILRGGTVRIDTDAISGPNHANAEAALQWIAKELGGNVIRTKRMHIGQHIHEHTHDEDHDHAHA